jgi:hypothetical protein
MKKLILINFSILFSFLPLKAMARTLPQDKQEFCSRFGSLPENRNILQDLASDSTSLMSFKNSGGLFDGGVCWWHSRFQRNILYLSIMRPDLEKPSTKEAMKKIITQIRLGNSVVKIPGYSNLEEFSRENQALIQEELNNWQLYDGIVLGAWINGLKGDTKTTAPKLKSMMDEVYQYVAINKKIVFEKLQIKGITSHAWLIVGMKKTESGYDLGLIDSNHPRMSSLYTYKKGDQSFFLKGYGDFLPYLNFKREEERITLAGKEFCGIRRFANSKYNVKLDYQRDLAEAKN